jgi:hypothetical protein
MRIRTFSRGLWAGLLLVVALAAAPALAQSTNAAPVIVQGTADIDPAALSIPDDARTYLTNAIANLKNGSWTAHVLAASPDGKNWAAAVAAKGAYYNLGDVARIALETCEYMVNYGPCLIYSVNGKDARDSSGGWPTQPPMFDIQPGSKFDPNRVPFVGIADRALIAKGYPLAAAPRALVITEFGGWTWNTGKTVFDAISTDLAACQKSYPNTPCLLYAVNDTVVFTP